MRDDEEGKPDTRVRFAPQILQSQSALGGCAMSKKKLAQALTRCAALDDLQPGGPILANVRF